MTDLAPDALAPYAGFQPTFAPQVGMASETLERQRGRQGQWSLGAVVLGGGVLR
jgi:hypothetical protein